MNILDTARLVIYRCHEKGLEVLLINPKASNDPSVWKLPNAKDLHLKTDKMISLDHIQGENGESVAAIAVEGDWHDIPSIRGLIKHDVARVKNKIKRVVPELEESTYFCIKDAFKKVLPQEYKALKELKDIIRDRNTITNI